MSDILEKLPDGTVDVLQIAGIVLIVVAVVLVALAVIVFFKLDIRGVRDDLAGRVRAERKPTQARGSRKRHAAQTPGKETPPQPAAQHPAAADASPGDPGAQPAPQPAPRPGPPKQASRPPGQAGVKFTVTKREIAPNREDVLGNKERNNG